MTILNRVLEERWLLYIGLFGLAVGLPLSRGFVSIAPGVIFGAWVFDGLYRKDFAKKWNSFTSNKIALYATLLFSVYLIWSIGNENGDKALKLIIDKLPLLLLPLSFSGLELPGRKSIDKLFSLHIAAILISTILSYVNWKINGADGEIRDSVLFVNHIRLSLMIVLATVLLFFDLGRLRSTKTLVKLLLVAWFIFFMYEFQIATGIGVLFLILLVFSIRVLFRPGRGRWLGIPLVVVAALLIGLVYPMAEKQFSKPPVPTDLLSARTEEGNRYKSLPKNLLLENGHYVWHYLQVDELRSAWNLRSDSLIGEEEGDESLFVGSIIRYLTSKGLRKDAEGVMALTDQDVRNIENGQSSILESETSGLEQRITELFWEIDSYHYGGDPSLSSLTVKFEYWKTGLRILKKNLWTGVGVGDIRDEFDREYAKGTLLDRSAWDKTHNQYLTWAIMFGLLGAVIALVAFVSPVFLTGKENRYLVILVYFTFLTSFLMEDTLETQLGLNLFLFYLGLLVMPSRYLSSTSR